MLFIVAPTPNVKVVGLWLAQTKCGKRLNLCKRYENAHRDIAKKTKKNETHICVNIMRVKNTNQRNRTMESVWKIKTDGKKGIFCINWHNNTVQIIFEKVPPKDIEITTTIKE